MSDKKPFWQSTAKSDAVKWSEEVLRKREESKKRGVPSFDHSASYYPKKSV